MSWLGGLQDGEDKIVHSAEAERWEASNICRPGLSRRRSALELSFLQC